MGQGTPVWLGRFHREIAETLLAAEGAGETDQVGPGFTVFGDAGDEVDGAVEADGERIHVKGAIAVGVEDGTLVGVAAGDGVVSNEVEIFEAFGFTHGGCVFAFDATAVAVDGAAGEVVEGGVVRAEREAEVAIAELVEHATSLRGERGEALEDFNARKGRIKAEEIAGVAVDTIDHLFGGLPGGLAPVVSHVAWRGRVVKTEVVFLHVLAGDEFERVGGWGVVVDGAFGGGEPGGAIAGVDGDGPTDRAVGGPLSRFALGAGFAKALELFGGEIEAEEDAAGPSEAEDAAAIGVQVHRENAFLLRGEGKVVETPGLEVVGEEMAAGIGFPSGRGNAHFFHAIDDAVVADVGGEVEATGGLDEVNVALALDDGFGVFLAASFSEVSERADGLGGGIEGEHFATDIIAFAAEDVVDPTVGGGADAVVSIVGVGKPGVPGAGGEFANGLEGVGGGGEGGSGRAEEEQCEDEREIAAQLGGECVARAGGEKTV
jgi:hypothetical protein